MLSRTHRFHGRSGLASVYRYGQTARAGHLLLRFARNNRNPDYRVAVIVSRKVHKSAVARNRLRRRIYEIIRTGPKIAEPFDLVITVFSDQVSELNPDELMCAIQNLFTKAKVYNKPKQPTGQAHAIVKPEKG